MSIVISPFLAQHFAFGIVVIIDRISKDKHNLMKEYTYYNLHDESTLKHHRIGEFQK